MIKRKLITKFGPRKHATEAIESSCRIEPSVTGNQYDIWQDDVIVGKISAEELVIEELPEPHFVQNSDKNKIYVQTLDGQEIVDYEVKEDDEETGNEADEFDSESETGSSSESTDIKEDEETFEDKCKSNKCVTFAKILEDINDYFKPQGATEGLAEVAEIAKEFPDFVGQWYAGNMKVSYLRKLYAVLKAVRDFHYDKPALAILKTGRALIETRKVFVLIDFKKKVYKISLYDADSKSGTVVHNAMLTNFGEFRQVDHIGFEAITGKSKELNRLICGCEAFTEIKDSCEISPDQPECLGVTCAVPANLKPVQDASAWSKFAQSFLDNIEELNDKQLQVFRETWKRFCDPDVLCDIYRCKSMDGTELNTYVVCLGMGVIEPHSIDDFCAFIRAAGATLHIVGPADNSKSAYLVINVNSGFPDQWEPGNIDQYRPVDPMEQVVPKLAIRHRVGAKLGIKEALDFGLRMVY